MAKLTDKFFNRVIEGPLELEAGEKINGDLELASGGEAKIFENIVDKDGHARFIEGDIELNNQISDVTKTYGKWSLSGTHLLLVLGFDVANGKTLGVGNELCKIALPSWVKDKIVPLWATSYIDARNFVMRADDWSTQQVAVNFVKNSQNEILFVVGASVTLDKARHVRIQYDLLIDNE